MIAAFTVSELLKENQQWRGGKNTPPPRLGLICYLISCHDKSHDNDKSS